MRTQAKKAVASSDAIFQQHQEMKAAKLITALALLGLHGAVGDDLAPPPPPPSDDATAAPTAAPTVPGWRAKSVET